MKRNRNPDMRVGDLVSPNRACFGYELFDESMIGLVIGFHGNGPIVLWTIPDYYATNWADGTESGGEWTLNILSKAQYDGR